MSAALLGAWPSGADALPIRGLTVAERNGDRIQATFTVFNPPAARRCTGSAAGVLFRTPRPGDPPGRVWNLRGGRWFLVASYGRNTVRFRPCTANGWDRARITIRFDARRLSAGRHMLCVRAWGTLVNGRNQNHSDCRRFDHRF